MAIQQNFCDPFSTANLLTLVALDDGDPSTPWQLSDLERTLKSTVFTLDIQEKEKLQPLQTDLFSLNLDDVPFPDLDSTTESAVATDAESDNVETHGLGFKFEKEEDVWSLPDVIHRYHTNGLLSWDAFLNKNYTEACPTYLSEGPEGAFGQLLHPFSRTRGQAVIRNAKPDVLLSSLHELCFGRESVFFGWDSKNGTFVKRINNYTLPDVSVDVVDKISLQFMQLGRNLRALHDFVDQEAEQYGNRVRKALSAAIGVILYAYESVIYDSGVNMTSLLHLQEATRRSDALVASLLTLAEHCPQDNEDLAPLIRLCNRLSENQPWSGEAIRGVVTRAISSQIEAVGQSIGLGSISTPSPTSINNSETDGHLTSNLFAKDTMAVLIESRQELTLLKDIDPSHLLFTHPGTSRINLQWDCTWEAISQLQANADEYEASLRHAILGLRLPQEFLQGSPPDRAPAMLEEQPNQTEFSEEGLTNLDSANMRMVLRNASTCRQDPLFGIVTEAISGSDVEHTDMRPDWEQSISLSITPLLTSQHRLLSYSILSLLFETHDLRVHLSTQSQFQLLGDGLFASRLSYALFDPLEPSGEGKWRNGGRTGLRLQSRDTWPPASSELRLVLMGILSDSMLANNHRTHRSRLSADAVRSLLESFSFAIRDLSDQDLEKCRDADSIHALDFLALQYKPHTPLLEAVITSRSLKVYDEIFVHLLRLLRLKYVTQELVRGVSSRVVSMSSTAFKDHRIRIEMHHFVATLADWAQNTVVRQKWISFASTIDKVDESVKRRDYNAVLLIGKGQEYIKSLHESVVDDIARTLFLKRKYMEVKAMINDMLDIVLQVAKHVRMRQSSVEETSDDGTTQRLYESFGRQVRRLLNYLRSHASVIRDERDARGPEALMEQLAVRLDVFGYYS